MIEHASLWLAILPILILILAIFDKRKQFFHNKIARTLVIDCKSSEYFSLIDSVWIKSKLLNNEKTYFGIHSLWVEDTLIKHLDFALPRKKELVM